MLQPAHGDGASADRGRLQAGRQRPRARAGFHRAAHVLAVTMVARGADDDVVRGVPLGVKE